MNHVGRGGGVMCDYKWIIWKEHSIDYMIHMETMEKIKK